MIISDLNYLETVKEASIEGGRRRRGNRFSFNNQTNNNTTNQVAEAFSLAIGIGSGSVTANSTAYNTNETDQSNSIG